MQKWKFLIAKTIEIVGVRTISEDFMSLIKGAVKTKKTSEISSQGLMTFDRYERMPINKTLNFYILMLIECINAAEHLFYNPAKRLAILSFSTSDLFISKP